MYAPLELLSLHRLLPLVTTHGNEDLQELANALLAENLPIVEVVLRTPAAIEALQRLQDLGLCVGVGTVRTRAQAVAALQSGASFLVSPAWNPDVAMLAKEAGVLYLPGVLTPTEVENALAEGFSILKFFPAEPFQGPKVLKAYSEVFPEARFVPTGGIREETLSDYAPLPNLLACGGSWLVQGSSQEIRMRIRRARAVLTPRAPG